MDVVLGGAVAQSNSRDYAAMFQSSQHSCIAND